MTHKTLTAVLNRLAVLLVIALSVATTACNSKEEDSPLTEDLTTASVAVTAFSLSPDIRVMKNLDSVFFSIDLEHGVIFNADSLPKGTNVTKLIPKISYPSSVKSATIEMTGGTHREGTVNYYTSSNDTIDFTGNVSLTLATANDKITKTYTLKVNVHQQDPDTIYWDRVYTSDFPKGKKEPIAQKSVMAGNGRVYTLIMEDFSYSVASTSDIFSGEWEVKEVEGRRVLDIESFTAGNGNLYVTDSNDNLLISDDGASWSPVPVSAPWHRVIGMYGDVLIGVGSDGKMACYPEGALPSVSLPEGFPTEGESSTIQYSNRWSAQPTIVVFGGYRADGSISQSSWAFDGSQWTDIADKPLPPLADLSVVKYYSYLNSATNGILKEFDVYLAFGGCDSDSNVNNTVYITYDQGITWQRAPQYMQLPEGVKAGYGVTALSPSVEMTGNLSDRWKTASAPRKLPFIIDGDLIKWECPYIFLIGGMDDGKFIDKIRCGVLQRLTFVPLF